MVNVNKIQVRSEEFDGMPAWRITSDTGASALVAERGASLISWEPRPGINVIDGYINADELKQASWSHSLIAAPWPGRVKDDTFVFDGVTYHLPPVPGRDTALHGFVWDEDFVVDDAGTSLTLRCDLEGVEGYPWPFTLRVTYSLESGSDGEEHLSASIAATNTGSTDIPLAIGWHPYVKLPGHETIADYDFSVPARTKVLYGSAMVPLLGEAAYSGVNSPVTFNPIGQVQMDESYRGLVPNEHGVVVTTVRDSASSMRVQLSQEPAEAPILHVYSGDGAPRDPRGSLALEPLSHLPDAFNRADCAGSIRLAPGATRHLTATISFKG